jgi:cellulose synthase/poly-beta-1,6-N-acetylglucosamine synthase-like glycosyltransferase
MALFDFIAEFFREIILFVPVGLIGVWRWSIWAIKRHFSSRWHDVPLSERTKNWKVGVVLTVKGEPPETFVKMLLRLVDEKIDQVCIVFDYREEENIELTQAFAAVYKDVIDVRFECTDKKGKRSGLSQAIAMSEGMHIIMCMDSDTLLGDGVKDAVRAAFTDPLIGGVAVGQRCHKPKSWVEHLFDIRLVVRYAQDIPGQAWGGRVTCLSGRCAAYLGSALKKIGPGLLTEEWAGIKKTGGGDDKYLTTALHDLGYHTSTVRNAWVYTRPEPSLKVYISQSLRWARNSWFSDFRALFSREWMRQTPVLMFYTIDRMISTFTILLSIWYLAFALYYQQWLVALILVVWWHVGRIIKAWPYFHETKRFYMIVPYTFMSFVLGILQIHALITLNEGSWLTRGASASAQMLRKTITNYFTKFVTTSIVCFVGVLVFTVLNDVPVPFAPDLDNQELNVVMVDPYAETIPGLVVRGEEPIYFYFPSESIFFRDYDRETENGGRLAEMRYGVLRYTPPQDFNGVDTFSYDLAFRNDDLGHQGTIQLTVLTADEQLSSNTQ